MGSIVALLIIVGFFTGIFFIIKSGKKRSEEFEKLAEKMGFSFSKKGDGTIIKEFDLHGDKFKHRTLKEANLLVKRESQLLVAIINGYYTGKHHRDFRPHTLFCFESSTLNLPDFSCAPGSDEFVDMAIKVFAQSRGYQKVRFESDPTFSEKYTVIGKDGETIKHLFYDSGVTSLCSKEESMHIDGIANKLVIYYKKTFPPKDIQGMFMKAEHIYSLLARQ